jgi:PatG C-terminal
VCHASRTEIRQSAGGQNQRVDLCTADGLDVDVIFSYTNRNTDFTEKFFTRVDVTDEFPFLVTKILPYYNR